MSVAYLSCPYSDPDPFVKGIRHTIATRVAFELMSQGIMVYSPLTHNLPIDQLGIHGTWATWKDFDHTMLSRCDRLIVLKLPGWKIPKEWRQKSLVPKNWSFLLNGWKFMKINTHVCQILLHPPTKTFSNEYKFSILNETGINSILQKTLQ